MKDKLKELLQAQKSLEEEVMHFNFETMTEQQRGEYIRNHTLFCEDELHEMLHEIPFFKEWKRYSSDPAQNEEKWKLAREEFVDALHFFLSIAVALGFNADTLLEAYHYKNWINHQRQLNQTEYKPSADEVNGD